MATFIELVNLDNRYFNFVILVNLNPDFSKFKDMMLKKIKLIYRIKESYELSVILFHINEIECIITDQETYDVFGQSNVNKIFVEFY